MGESIFALAAATVGSITLEGCRSSGTSPGETRGPVPAIPRSAGLSWTVKGLENDGAFAYLEVARELVVAGVHLDLALSPSLGASTAGFTQALCRAWVSRGAPPPSSSAPSSAGPASHSADFGPISLYNPGGLTVTADGNPLQDVFYSATLRSWVPATGVDSAAARSVYALPALMLNAGDYLVFGIEQSGVPGDLQWQALLDYE